MFQARESAKIEHEKKLSLLQSQEYKGEKVVKLDKTKASIKKLQSLIMVASQAVNTTSSAITTVRDNELGPQLLELCHGYNQYILCLSASFCFSLVVSMGIILSYE